MIWPRLGLLTSISGVNGAEGRSLLPVSPHFTFKKNFNTEDVRACTLVYWVMSSSQEGAAAQSQPQNQSPRKGIHARSYFFLGIYSIPCPQKSLTKKPSKTAPLVMVKQMIKHHVSQRRPSRDGCVKCKGVWEEVKPLASFLPQRQGKLAKVHQTKGYAIPRIRLIFPGSVS